MDNYALVADQESVQIVDVGGLSLSPAISVTDTPDGYMHSIDFYDGYVIGVTSGKLHVINADDVFNPGIVGSANTGDMRSTWKSSAI